MTDITDDDRKAHEWASDAAPSWGPRALSAARAIKAHVPAPPPTLSEKLCSLADLLDNGDQDGDTSQVLRGLVARAAKMAHDLTEVRAGVERLTAENEELRRTDNYKEFRDKFLTVQKGAESNAETPNPADVPEGEMWLIDTDYDKGLAGVRHTSGRWSALASNGYAREVDLDDDEVTLVARLVPDTRHVIDQPEGLDALPVESVVLNKDGAPCQNWGFGKYWVCGDNELTAKELIYYDGPVTVIHIPEVVE